MSVKTSKRQAVQGAAVNLHAGHLGGGTARLLLRPEAGQLALELVKLGKDHGEIETRSATRPGKG